MNEIWKDIKGFENYQINCFWVRESDYIDFGISKCKKKRNVNNIDLTKKSEVFE